MKKYLLLCFAIIISHSQVLSKESKFKADEDYYKHWKGSWYRVNGEIIDEAPTFVVTQALYEKSFKEYWMGAGGDFSIGFRAWDSMSKKWQFSWMSEKELFQLWEGKKVNDIWYMYKTFVINGEKILSRQAFIPKGEGELLRTSEHSKDNGETWTIRFKELYRKK